MSSGPDNLNDHAVFAKARRTEDIGYGEAV
jgi:hypothetical protein